MQYSNFMLKMSLVLMANTYGLPSIWRLSTVLSRLTTSHAERPVCGVSFLSHIGMVTFRLKVTVPSATRNGPITGHSGLTRTYAERQVFGRNQSPDQITQVFFRKDRIIPGNRRSLASPWFCKAASCRSCWGSVLPRTTIIRDIWQIRRRPKSPSYCTDFTGYALRWLRCFLAFCQTDQTQQPGTKKPNGRGYRNDFYVNL